MVTLNNELNDLTNKTINLLYLDVIQKQRITPLKAKTLNPRMMSKVL